ncbi:MAG TPA: RdgB/HAM1 family non-canonical purine NTP pyrophosphatase, partial [Stellaceae bacterium]|nr:RdgB/HAM1 family non-canonical purine NTP pyrophosphatase [Stellaceae bacterium]
MARRFASDRLVIATHNRGKLDEMAALLRPFGVAAVSAASLGLAEPEETGDSFEANAELKALAAAKASGLPALADDSGLVVPALDGAPGIFSARWAGPERDFARAMALVEEQLRGKGDRRAHFVAVLALAWSDEHVECFRGEVHGDLVFPPRGKRGFGYDPIFVPAGGSETFGEMEPAAKHAISHRG